MFVLFLLYKKTTLTNIIIIVSLINDKNVKCLCFGAGISLVWIIVKKKEGFASTNSFFFCAFHIIPDVKIYF